MRRKGEERILKASLFIIFFFKKLIAKLFAKKKKKLRQLHTTIFWSSYIFSFNFRLIHLIISYSSLKLPKEVPLIFQFFPSTQYEVIFMPIS